MIKSRYSNAECTDHKKRVDERFHDPGVLPTDDTARTLWFMYPEEWRPAIAGEMSWQYVVQRMEMHAQRYEEGER